MALNRRSFIILCAVAGLAACNTFVPYRDQGPKNLTIALGALEGGS